MINHQDFYQTMCYWLFYNTEVFLDNWFSLYVLFVITVITLSMKIPQCSHQRWAGSDSFDSDCNDCCLIPIPIPIPVRIIVVNSKIFWSILIPIPIPIPPIIYRFLFEFRFSNRNCPIPGSHISFDSLTWISQAGWPLTTSVSYTLSSYD